MTESGIAIPNIQITPHFKLSDFTCRHCGQLIISELFLQSISGYEGLRVVCDFPILIDSGQRCEFHNSEVGGKPNSWHMCKLNMSKPVIRFAIDGRPQRLFDDTDETIQQKLKRMEELGPKYGFRGIGIYDGFRHMDMRPIEERWEG